MSKKKNKNNGAVASGLPDFCYSYNPGAEDEVVLLKRGVMGYVPTEHRGGVLTAAALNAELGVTKAQEQAMLAGSIFGFAVKAADPALYDKNGNVQLA